MVPRHPSHLSSHQRTPHGRRLIGRACVVCVECFWDMSRSGMSNRIFIGLTCSIAVQRLGGCASPAPAVRPECDDERQLCFHSFGIRLSVRRSSLYRHTPPGRLSFSIVEPFGSRGMPSRIEPGSGCSLAHHRELWTHCYWGANGTATPCGARIRCREGLWKITRA